MQTITTSNGNFTFIDVPDGAANFTFYMNVLYYQIAPHLGVNDPMYSYSFNHGSNNYQFLCTSDTATEQQAAEIVDKVAKAYKQYHFAVSVCDETGEKYDDYCTPCSTALKSFASLLAHHNITTRQAILKQL